MKMAMRLAVVAVLALSCGVGYGCSRKPKDSAAERKAERMAEKSIERETGGEAEVEIRDGNINVTTEEGEVRMSMGEGAKLPDDFPTALVPIYKGAKIMQSVSMPEGQVVMLETDDGAPAVLEFYTRELTAAGWNVEVTMKMAGGDIMTLKREEASLSVMVLPGEPGVSIQLTYARE